jgi:RNA polymerase sigma-70 factor (ECF subfamily)
MVLKRITRITVLEDKILICKLKDGDRDALRRIYEKYRDYLLRIAAGLLHDQCLAEDIVHDVFAKFVQSPGRYKPTGSLKGYLATCVINNARNVYRARSRHQTVSLDQIDPPISKHKRPDQWIIHHERSEQIHDAMTQLPYDQKEVIVLRLQADMKFKDIAKLQETSVKTALSRYRYGIDKLRSLLKSKVLK